MKKSLLKIGCNDTTSCNQDFFSQMHFKLMNTHSFIKNQTQSHIQGLTYVNHHYFIFIT